MNFSVVPMNIKYANDMICNWKYDEIYHIYDYKYEEDDLLDKNKCGIEKFAVLNEKHVLVGKLTVEFLKKKISPHEEACVVDYSIVKNETNGNYNMWLGWGLKPELCGRGFGFKFISECIDFSLKKYN